jgi:probable phosphoglycerate mutase
MAAQEVFVIRHGETAWSLSGQHTGVSDIPLTENGRRIARGWQPVLARKRFALVLTSPLRRARETCELTGLAGSAEIDRDLGEWNYGEYEGLTSEQIHSRSPGWMVFRDGAPGGESPAEVGARVDRIIARARQQKGNVALFSHGHLLRVLAARWLDLPASSGCHFLLDTATVSVLSSYRGCAALKHWNVPLLVADCEELMRRLEEPLTHDT